MAKFARPHPYRKQRGPERERERAGVAIAVASEKKGSVGISSSFQREKCAENSGRGERQIMTGLEKVSKKEAAFVATCTAGSTGACPLDQAGGADGSAATFRFRIGSTTPDLI